MTVIQLLLFLRCHQLCLCVRQAVLSEDLRPLVSLEALQREEVERPAAAGGLLLLRPGPGTTHSHTHTHCHDPRDADVYCECVCGASALHWNAAVHHPAVPAAHHGSLLPGLHSGKTSHTWRHFNIAAAAASYSSAQ